MKKFNKKALILASVLCLSLFALVGCGGDDTTNVEDETPTAEEEAQTIHDYDDIAATFETPDDYFEALDTFTAAAKNVKTDLANRLAEIDTADQTAVAEVVDTVKKPFTQFMAATAPADYAEANQYYTKACEQIIAYIDAAAKGEDASAQLEEAMGNINAGTTAVTDILVKTGNTQGE